MIPLSEIDHRRVLDGARVPLCWHITDEDIAAADHATTARLLEDTRNARIEWCGDIGWRNEGAGYPPQFFREPWGAMAIDPTHPDVAPVLDRKIAEAAEPGVGIHPCQIRTGGYETLPDRFWVIDFLTPRGAGWMRIQRDEIANIEPTTANIPAARAALIRALYPAVKV